LRTDHSVNCANLQNLQNAIRHKWSEVGGHTIWKSILENVSTAVTKWNGGPIYHIFCWTFRFV